jgi:hypothetical protein
MNHVTRGNNDVPRCAPDCALGYDFGDDCAKFDISGEYFTVSVHSYQCYLSSFLTFITIQRFIILF